MNLFIKAAKVADSFTGSSDSIISIKVLKNRRPFAQ